MAKYNPIQDQVEDAAEEIARRKARHTPGPWTAKKCECSERWYVEIRENGYKAAIVFSSGICGDARHIGGERFQGTEEANARLIAAAPDLAAALLELAEIGEAGVIERRETGKPTWSVLEAVATIARAALSRAGY